MSHIRTAYSKRLLVDIERHQRPYIHQTYIHTYIHTYMQTHLQAGFCCWNLKKISGDLIARFPLLHEVFKECLRHNFLDADIVQVDDIVICVESIDWLAAYCILSEGIHQGEKAQILEDDRDSLDWNIGQRYGRWYHRKTGRYRSL